MKGESMKYFMMTIFKKGKAGGFAYIYPQRFESFVDSIVVGPIYEHNEKVGKCKMVFGTSPKFTSRFLNCAGTENGNTFDVEEIGKKTFIGFWKYQESKIAPVQDLYSITGDINNIVAILAKAVLGKELSEDERNSIDSDKEDIGIGKPFSVEDRLESILSRFETKE